MWKIKNAPLPPPQNDTVLTFDVSLEGAMKLFPSCPWELKTLAFNALDYSKYFFTSFPTFSFSSLIFQFFCSELKTMHCFMSH